MLGPIHWLAKSPWQKFRISIGRSSGLPPSDAGAKRLQAMLLTSRPEMPLVAPAIDRYVGGKLAAARGARGLSQTALGDAVGLTFRQIQKYEKGLVRIGAGRLCDIARVLGVPVKSFFEGAPLADAAATADAVPKIDLLDLEILRHLSRTASEDVKRAVLDLIKAAMPPADRSPR